MVRFERHKDSDYLKDGVYTYPPNAWVRVTRYKCSNCGEESHYMPAVCPLCGAEMEISIY